MSFPNQNPFQNNQFNPYFNPYQQFNPNGQNPQFNQNPNMPGQQWPQQQFNPGYNMPGQQWPQQQPLNQNPNMLNPPPPVQIQPGQTVLMTESQLQNYVNNNGGSVRGLEIMSVPSAQQQQLQGPGPAMNQFNPASNMFNQLAGPQGQQSNQGQIQQTQRPMNQGATMPHSHRSNTTNMNVEQEEPPVEEPKLETQLEELLLEEPQQEESVESRLQQEPSHELQLELEGPQQEEIVEQDEDEDEDEAYHLGTERVSRFCAHPDPRRRPNLPGTKSSLPHPECPDCRHTQIYDVERRAAKAKLDKVKAREEECRQMLEDAQRELQNTTEERIALETYHEQCDIEAKALLIEIFAIQDEMERIEDENEHLPPDQQIQRNLFDEAAAEHRHRR